MFSTHWDTDESVLLVVHMSLRSLIIISIFPTLFQIMDAIKGTMTEIYNDLSKNTSGNTIAEVRVWPCGYWIPFMITIVNVHVTFLLHVPVSNSDQTPENRNRKITVAASARVVRNEAQSWWELNQLAKLSACSHPFLKHRVLLQCRAYNGRNEAKLGTGEREVGVWSKEADGTGEATSGGWDKEETVVC